MNNYSDRPTKLTRVKLVLELCSDVNNPPMFLQVITSIPGREGAFTKTWSTPNGRLDLGQHEDLLAWVADMITDTLLLEGGIQGLLGAS